MKNDDAIGTFIAATVVFIVALIVGFITIALLIAIRGLLICKLWVWFIVPVFALPILSLPQAIGLSIVIGLLTLHSMPENTKSLGKTLVTPIIYYALVLLTGYIVHLFM